MYGKSCQFTSHLMKTCPLLLEKYVPPLWAVSGHVTTIARSMIQTKPPISYDRCVRLHFKCISEGPNSVRDSRDFYLTHIQNSAQFYTKK